MKKSLLAILCMFVLCSSLLNACAATTAEDETPSEEVSSEVTSTEAASKVGGTFVWAISPEPDTLDPQKTASSTSYSVLALIGTSLVAMAPDGTVIPYAAESWTTSEDGLVWEFKLRTDMKFHNGEPITAKDYAWTYQRAIDPETASPAAASMLGSMVSAEAVDDYTLRLTQAEAYYPFLSSLASPGYLQPLPQAALEEMGEDAFSHAPIGSGPYILKEWLTGDRIVLERNPDYYWGPDYGGNTGPYYIERIEFRTIPEYATQIAGMEAGEIDYMVVEDKDLGSFQDNAEYTVYDHPYQGMEPYIALNLQVPPFNDINVRKALNLAVNRQALIDVMLNGRGMIQYGPISKSVIGYWPGVEEIGYGYDLDQAADYMETAGYERDADGKWTKNGAVFSIPFTINSSTENSVKVAQLIQQQYKDFGIDVQLDMIDPGIFSDTVIGGNFQASFVGWDYPEADLLFLIFHSSMIGALNMHYLDNPEIDALLEKTRTETDATARQQAVDDVQKWIVENAIAIPLYTPVQNYVLRTNVEGEIHSLINGIYYQDAYIIE